MLYARNKLINVGGWWPPQDVERVDEARKGTYLNRSAFIRRNLLEHLDELEVKGKDGCGALPARKNANNPEPTNTPPLKGVAS